MMGGLNKVELHEFVCTDCGIHVFSYAVAPANDDGPSLCMDCSWLASLPEGEQQAVRAFLGRASQP